MNIQRHTTLHAMRRGITLLEVLIAIGILAIGLSSVVALIPAGRSQAARAVVLDRASCLAANALSDAVTFGLLRPDALTGTAGLSIIDPLGLAVSGTAVVNAIPVTLKSRGLFSAVTDLPAQAASHFLFTQGRDDLVFSTGTSVDSQQANADGPPFNAFSDGTRAYQGRMSCFYAIQQPVLVPSVSLLVLSATSGSPLVTVSSTSGLRVGMTLICSGVPSVTKILAIDASDTPAKVTLSQNCTATFNSPRQADALGSPGTLTIVVFHGRDPGNVKPITATITNGVVDTTTSADFASAVKPGVVVCSGLTTAQFRFHQVLTCSIVGSGLAFMTFSTGNALLTGTHTLSVLTDSVGLAEQSFIAEETGPYLQ